MTTPHAPRRSLVPPLFPAYSPNPDTDPLEEMARHITRWARRLVVIVTAIGALAGVLSAYGFRGPRTEPRLAAVEDSVRAHSQRLQDVERMLRSNIYIACQTLSAVQPHQVAPPQECQNRQEAP